MLFFFFNADNLILLSKQLLRWVWYCFNILEIGNLIGSLLCSKSHSFSEQCQYETFSSQILSLYRIWCVDSGATSVVSNSVRPSRRQPTRLLCPRDSVGKNTGVGCHFLLQCVKVKSLSCAWLLATPRTAAHQALPSMGFSRQEYWSGVPLPSPIYSHL